MKIYRSPSQMQRVAQAWKRAGRSVGFVPTLGALHEGHASLIRRARRENDIVVVSVFVNPTQFGPREDFARYPRPLARDTALCRREEVTVVFHPSASQLYPPGFQTWVTVDDLSRPLCGPFRPGHFRGVATVVLKLLNRVQPDRAYFGEKDFQQLRIVQRLVRDLDVPVKIVPCPTVRAPCGLALSSRNLSLSPAGQAAAPLLNRALRAAGEVLESRRSPAAARRAAVAILKTIPGAKIQYVEVVDPDTLTPPSPSANSWRVAAAVFVGATRLIDNWFVRRPGPRAPEAP